MRRIGIDTIDPARRDDADFGHFFQLTVAGDVRLHVARLDRAGVGAQQNAVGNLAIGVLQVEGIVHRTRRVILGRVQGGEIEKILLDLGAVGDFEADRTEQRFDALQRPRDRMQAATRFAATGQRDIERLFGQARRPAPPCGSLRGGR
jgi:hypothetical protein